jgi:Domain of unknown function (DUF4189)
MTRLERLTQLALVVVLCGSTFGAQAVAQSFASVAVNLNSGAWGASLGQRTANAAGTDANRRCGGNCQIGLTKVGRCVAVASGSNGGHHWFGFAAGEFPGDVNARAINGCKKRGPGCRIAHSNCIPGPID